MNKTIDNFLKSLEKVEESDFTISKAILVEEQFNVHEDEYSTYENNFVTKLNEKYAILNEIGIIKEPKELIRQFQIPKKYVYGVDRDIVLERCVDKMILLLGDKVDTVKELSLIPDFIIHKEQDNMDMENQRLIVEVKTEANISYKKFAWDFFKLNIYVEKMKFQNGIFLSINTEIERIEEFIHRYITDKLYIASRPFDIYFIIKKNYSTDAYTLALWEYMYTNGRKK